MWPVKGSDRHQPGSVTLRLGPEIARLDPACSLQNALNRIKQDRLAHDGDVMPPDQVRTKQPHGPRIRRADALAPIHDQHRPRQTIDQILKHGLSRPFRVRVVPL